MVEPGRLLSGRYELLARIGRGGMGEVFHARDRLLERAVAVKVLSPALSADAPLLGRFGREARVAASLIHPNIVTVFDTGRDDGLHFIVMELVEGPSLADRIRRDAPLPSARVIEILRPMTAALAAAHDQGLVHRDVKPANILFTRDGTPKLTDFGIARAAAAVTQTASVYGTALYMAPEQARGDPSDPRVDVYALGCVAYEMLTGRPVFEGETALGLLYHHLHTAPEPPSRRVPGISPALEAVVLRMLAKDPAYRHPRMREVAEDLDLVAGGGWPGWAAGSPEESTGRIAADTALLPPPGEGAEPPAEPAATAVLGAGGAGLIGPARDAATRRLEAVETPPVLPGTGPQPAAQRRRTREAIIIAAILLLLLGMGLAYGFVRRSTDQPVVSPSASPARPTSHATSTGTSNATPTATRTATASPRAPAPISPPAASPTATEAASPAATTAPPATSSPSPSATPSFLPSLTPKAAGTSTSG